MKGHGGGGGRAPRWRVDDELRARSQTQGITAWTSRRQREQGKRTRWPEVAWTW